MKDISLEFGLLIAYAIPGAFALYGFAAFLPGLAALTTLPDNEKWLSTALLLTGFIVALGMFVSVIRSLLIDTSFALSLPGANSVRPHGRPVTRVDPDYPVMKNKDVLAALQDARLSDKHPYQFYGNMLVALAIFEASRIKHGTVMATEIAITLLAVAAFYLASHMIRVARPCRGSAIVSMLSPALVLEN